MTEHSRAIRATVTEFRASAFDLRRGIVGMLGASLLALNIGACGHYDGDEAGLAGVEEASWAQDSARLEPVQISKSDPLSEEPQVTEKISWNRFRTPVKPVQVAKSDPFPESQVAEVTTSAVPTVAAESQTSAPMPASTDPVTLTAQSMLSDMTQPHAMLAHGIPADWSWGSGPRLGLGHDVPSSYASPAFAPWGIAATAAIGSPAKNVRVQIRKMVTDFKLNGTWKRVDFASGSEKLSGAIYTNYQTNANTAANLRAHGVDGISVKLPQSGGSFHFFSNRFPIATTGLQGVVVKLEARLIVDDPNLPDDRRDAKLMVLTGGDFWRSLTAQWDPATYSNDDFAIGRFRQLTNEWQVITSHSLVTDAQLNEYLNAERSLAPR